MPAGNLNHSSKARGFVNIRIATFVQQNSIPSLRAAIVGGKVMRAETWSELTLLLQENRFHAVGVDPYADGTMNIEAITDLMRRFSLLPFFAYVRPTALSLKAILELSKHGLKDVFLQPLGDDLRFRRAVEMLATERPIRELLWMIRVCLDSLPTDINLAVHDLFLRPGRYSSAEDLAFQARVSIKGLDRSIDRARLGNAKKLIIAAKVLRGYGFLHLMNHSPEEASHNLGYPCHRVFVNHVKAALDRRPSELRAETDGESVVIAVLTWVQGSRPNRSLRRVRTC